MVATYYIKIFRTEADRHNGILMSILLLVAETISSTYRDWWDIVRGLSRGSILGPLFFNLLMIFLYFFYLGFL